MGKKHKQEKSSELVTHVDCHQVDPKKSKKSKISSTNERSRGEDVDVKKPGDIESVAVDVKTTSGSKKKRKRLETDHRGTEQSVEHATETTLKCSAETLHHSLDNVAEAAENQTKHNKKGRKDRDLNLGRNPEEMHRVIDAECVTAVSSDEIFATRKGKKSKKSKTEVMTDEVNVAKSNDSEADRALACKVDNSVATEVEPNERKAGKRKRKHGEALKSDCLLEATDVSGVPVEVSEMKAVKKKKSRKQTDKDGLIELSANVEAGSSQVLKDGEVFGAGKATIEGDAGQSQKAADLNCTSLQVSAEQDVVTVEKKKHSKKSNKVTVPERHKGSTNETEDETNHQSAPAVNRKKNCMKGKELQTATENVTTTDALPEFATTKKLKKSKENIENENRAVLSDIAMRDNKSKSNGEDIAELKLKKTVEAKKSRKQKGTESKNEELTSENNANTLMPLLQREDIPTGTSIPNGVAECQIKKKSRKATADDVNDTCPLMVYSQSSKGKKRAKQEASSLVDGGELQKLAPESCSDAPEEVKRSKRRKKKEENDDVGDVGEMEGHRDCDGENIVEAGARAKKKSSKRKHSFSSIPSGADDNHDDNVTRNTDANVEDSSLSNLPASDLKQKKSKTKKETSNPPETRHTEETALVPDSKSATYRKRKQKTDKRETGDELLGGASIELSQSPSNESRDVVQPVTSSSGSKKSRKHADATESAKCPPSDVFDKNDVSSTIVEPSEPASSLANCNMGQWARAGFDSSDRLPKFVRLLGGMKNADKAGGLGKAPWLGQEAAKTGSAALAMSRAEEEQLSQSLEQQFSQARNLAFFGQKRGGLGYEPPPDAGKKLYIDKAAVKSKKFDD